jgi:hypothetical protein
MHEVRLREPAHTNQELTASVASPSDNRDITNLSWTCQPDCHRSLAQVTADAASRLDVLVIFAHEIFIK